MSEAKTLSLSEFLLARIAEDEAAARAATNPRGTAVYVDGPAAEHFARHDPARVLAECAAKRRIVEHASECDEAPIGGHCYSCDVTLRALASVYADHPDYREDWRA